MLNTRKLTALAVASALLFGCGGEDGETGAKDTSSTADSGADTAAASDTATNLDAGAAADSSNVADSGAAADTAQAADTGSAMDTSAPTDTTTAKDTGAAADAGGAIDSGNTGSTDAAAADATTADAGPKGCAGFDEDDCKKEQTCAPMYANDACANATAPVKIYAGCMDANISCGGAMTCASREGTYGIFTSTCLPFGWKFVSGDIDNCCPPKSQDEWYKCTKDDECTWFETKCCDHCNGGEAIAVNSKHLDTAKNVLKTPAEQCKGTACTLKACLKPTAVCTNGKCVLKK